jgi:hypothetical protein
VRVYAVAIVCGGGGTQPLHSYSAHSKCYSLSFPFRGQDPAKRECPLYETQYIFYREKKSTVEKRGISETALEKRVDLQSALEKRVDLQSALFPRLKGRFHSTFSTEQKEIDP